MPTPEDWKAAVAAGIVEAGQAERLATFLSERDRGQPAPGDASETEEVRFARGFHDVFLTVGVTLLLLGLGIAVTTADAALLGYPFAALVAWGLAEYLARVRRLVLPAIVLAIGFVFYVGIAAATVSIFFLFAYYAPDFTDRYRTAIFLIAGLLIFAGAMTYDLKDPERRTIKADKAFWLHLLAAPLLVHTIVSYVSLDRPDATDIAGAAAVIGVIAALAVVALMVDRRALLVAGLGYLGIAIASLIGKTNAAAETVGAVTLIILGCGVVVLGAGWQSARSALLSHLPLPSVLLQRLPPAVKVR